MWDLAYELIGSTRYLNKSRACENSRFYFPFSKILVLPPFSCQKQNKVFSWKNIFLEEGEEEEEHEKEQEKRAARIMLDSGEIPLRVFFARMQLHFLYRAHLQKQRF